MREDSKWPTWERIKDPDARSVASESMSESSAFGRDEGETFVSSTNGRRYTKYYDDAREEYYYVDEETNETTWDHPDGETMEFVQSFVPVAFMSASEPVAPPEDAVVERTISREDYIESKLAKMMVIEEKWLEKLPASQKVPGRPEAFEGVYGERERYWDPEADTYSVDNNEGSEHGMEIFEEAYEAEDALERYTSAVDLATPEDMRPMNVAMDYVTNLLLVMFEMIEEEQDFAFAEKRVRRRKAKGARKFTHAGQRVVGVRRFSLSDAPEITTEIEFENTRANTSAKLSMQRLQFNADELEATKAIFYQRLVAPMKGIYKSGTVIERVDLNDAEPHFGINGNSIARDDASEASSYAIAHAPHKVATAGVGDEHASDRLNFDASTSSSVSDDEDARQRTTPPKRRGFLGRLFPSAKDKRERRATKANAAQARRDEQELLNDGYVAPWERNPESVRFLTKPDSFDESTLPRSLRTVEGLK
jgi:hypothetical protein